MCYLSTCDHIERAEHTWARSTEYHQECGTISTTLNIVWPQQASIIPGNTRKQWDFIFSRRICGSDSQVFISQNHRLTTKSSCEIEILINNFTLGDVKIFYYSFRIITFLSLWALFWSFLCGTLAPGMHIQLSAVYDVYGVFTDHNSKRVNGRKHLGWAAPAHSLIFKRYSTLHHYHCACHHTIKPQLHKYAWDQMKRTLKDDLIWLSYLSALPELVCGKNEKCIKFVNI